MAASGTAIKACKRAALPKTNPDFWEAKLSANADRDRAVGKVLRHAGWHTLIVWNVKS